MNQDYYVYLHRRNDTNEVFYVGKGRRYRCSTRWNRSKWWLAIVDKHGYTVEFVEKGLTEDDALDLEVETIKFYRDCGHKLCNLTDGGEGVSGVVRKQEITDGIMIDLSIKIDTRIKNYTSKWNLRGRIALQMILTNLLKGQRIYYNRGKEPAVKCKENMRGISSYKLIQAINKLEAAGWLENTVTTRYDSVKRLSSIVASSKFINEFLKEDVSC